MENMNSRRYLEDMKQQVLQILKCVEIAPGVQINTGQAGTTQLPPSAGQQQALVASARTEQEENPDILPHENGSRPEHPAEFYEIPRPMDL
jgi:hypothetical protein